MKPLDPRLLRYARSSRGALATAALVGLGTTLCIIAFSWLVTSVITGVIDGADAAGIARALGGVAVIVVLRSILSWLTEVVGMRAAARAKSELREGVLSALDTLGAGWLARHNSARLTTLLGHGLDALDDYFARYIPQLLLTALAVPVLLITVLSQDWLSAVILAVTLPIIPVFMVLVGLATRSVQRKQWNTLSRLSAQFLDVIGGLATLKIFGRERRQLTRMRDITDDYRGTTMAVLRVSFLSGFVLELFSSLSVALVAVSIGFRLVDGSLPLATGLFVLLLAPEVFQPLRQVGANFHAAAEGVEAAEDAFAILDEAAAAPIRPAHARELRGDLTLDEVTIRREGTVVVDGLSAVLRRGHVTAITGPSGVGKSSLLAAIAGVLPHEGAMRVDGVDVSGAPVAARDWLAWAPQDPSLQAGTVRSNVSLGDPAPNSAVAEQCLRLAAAGDIRLDTGVGVGGAGLSGGQAQRVGVARAYYRALTRGCSVVALDEPSSALDARTEHSLARGIRELAGHGIAVVLVSHREALVEWADETIRLDAGTAVPA
ncbi:ATP-binding cassette, subfamily C, CydD [Paramicrobacterium humi]|uniref:ATP-binding cassette, subfamily C, CydD n=1 Tax=Paramicrobacterium humi TaxID=640635 RepID=A0A1H4QBW9_9MICO|nr:thiol reductant ABC exporter subunit CydD [Microbacterium humi]SEC17081.1 ATP-binding cassette, subfamily C, CydD [Microbacterium humi]